MVAAAVVWAPEGLAERAAHYAYCMRHAPPDPERFDHSPAPWYERWILSLLARPITHATSTLP